MSDQKWLYGLTADEWFSLACKGEDSEIAPCCGNVGWLRDELRCLMVFQVPADDWGFRQSIGKRILHFIDSDGGHHDLTDPEFFPLLNRVLDGLRDEARKSIFDVIDGEKNE